MTVTPEPEPSDRERPWWDVRKETEPPASDQTSRLPPGVHIVVQPPEPTETPAQERERVGRQRTRRWLAVHGAAAAVGWALGLYAAVTELLRTGGVAAGLALAAMAYVGADLVMARYLRFVPPRLRPLATWVTRIPFATALLATVLHTPNALIGAST